MGYPVGGRGHTGSVKAHPSSQRQRAPPPGQSSGEEQPQLPPALGLESANTELLLCVRTFTQILI